MRLVVRSVVVLFMACFSAVAVFAQERLTEHTLKLAPGREAGAATIDDMAWLEGRWVGEGLGGFVEEIWSPPRSGVMIGMFRLLRDGDPVFYEILTLVEEEGSLLLRLKHFHPDLRGWEEKDQTVDFRFVTKQDGRIRFSGLTFRPEGDELTMFLAIRRKDGTFREETLRFRRASCRQG
jgi:hypothetical protein